MSEAAREAVKRRFKPHVGRPRKGEETKTLTATKPWEKQNISRRTWYRRKRKR